MRVTGAEELRRKLERMARNASSLRGTQEVPLTDLMPDEFIRRYTRYPNLQEMIDAGGIEASEDLSGEAWDAFVAEHSDFSGWTEMQQRAATEWTQRRLHR